MSTIPFHLLNDNQLYNVISSINYLNKFFGKINGKVDGIRQALTILSRNKIYTGNIMAVTNNTFFEILNRVHVALSFYFLHQFDTIKKLNLEKQLDKKKLIDEIHSLRSLERINTFLKEYQIENISQLTATNLTDKIRVGICECISTITFNDGVNLYINVDGNEAKCSIVKQCKFGLLKSFNLPQNVTVEILPFEPLEEPSNFTYTVYESTKPNAVNNFGNAHNRLNNLTSAFHRQQVNKIDPVNPLIQKQHTQPIKSQTQINQVNQVNQIKPISPIKQAKTETIVTDEKKDKKFVEMKEKSKEMKQSHSKEKKVLSEIKDFKETKEKKDMKETHTSTFHIQSEKDLKEENERLRKRIEQLEKENKQQQTIITELKQNTDSQEKKIEQLKEVNKQWSETYNDIKSKYDDEQNELKKMKHQVKTIQRQQSNGINPPGNESMNQSLQMSMNVSMNPESLKKIKTKMEQLKNANDQWAKAYQQKEEELNQVKKENEEVKSKALDDCSVLQLQIQKRNEEIKQLKGLLDQIMKLASSGK